MLDLTAESGETDGKTTRRNAPDDGPAREGGGRVQIGDDEAAGCACASTGLAGGERDGFIAHRPRRPRLLSEGRAGLAGAYQRGAEEGGREVEKRDLPKNVGTKYRARDRFPIRVLQRARERGADEAP